MKLLHLKINRTIDSVINFDGKKGEIYNKTYIVEKTGGAPELFSLPVSNNGEFGKRTIEIQTEKGGQSLFLLSIEEIIGEQNSSLLTNTIVVKLLGLDYSNLDTKDERLLADIFKENAPKIKRMCGLDVASGVYVCNSSSPEQTLEYSIIFELQILSKDNRSGEDLVSIAERLSLIDNRESFERRHPLKDMDKDDLLYLINARRYEMKVVLTPVENIHQATLDFGSEASQVLEYKLDAGRIGGHNILKLFKEMGTMLGKTVESDGDVNSSVNSPKNMAYIQYDKDSRLFRSHYFAPRKIKADKAIDPAGNPKENENIKLFNTYEEIESFKKEFFTLPNVKIATLSQDRPQVQVIAEDGEYDDDATQFGDRFFYRSAINSFIYQILRHVAKPGGDSDRIYLRLMVLMPNVYNQKEQSERLKDITEDVNTMIGRAPFKNRIGGVEVNSISESDASIIGWMNVDPNMALSLHEGNYLILDAGKGTLDLSVLKFNQKSNKQKYICEYRSGIVGAGNAISYAVFLDMMHMMLKSKGVKEEDIELGIKQIITDVIIPGDEASLAEMMRYIDHYKCLYGAYAKPEITGAEEIRKEGSSPSKNPFTVIDKVQGEIRKKVLTLQVEGKQVEFSLQLILNWIKSQFENSLDPLRSTIKDIRSARLPYTERMIQNLADDALRSFGYRGRIDYVVLSGRSFQMPQFRWAIERNIKSVPKWKNAEFLVWEDNGQVINAKNICLFVTATKEYDGRIVGRPFLRKYGEDPTLFKTEEQIAEDSRWNKIKGILRRILEEIAEYFSDAEPVDRMSNRDYTDGISVRTNSGDQVCISGTYYSLPENASDGGYGTIFFDGNEFLFVANNEERSFKPPVAPPVYHLFESMFPYGSLPENIPFPSPLRKMLKIKTVEDKAPREPEVDNEDVEEKDKGVDDILNQL